MKELGITKGEWYWDGDPTNYDHKNEAPWLIAGGVPIITGEIEAKNKADVDLIVDAGNTAQKCGLLPSELLRQRDELRDKYSKLLDATSELLKSMKTDNVELKKSIAEMRINMAKEIAAIKNTDG